MENKFKYDRGRKDTAFQAVMKTAKGVFEDCNGANCLKCPYYRAGPDKMLVVCYTETLADRLIERGIVK